MTDVAPLERVLRRGRRPARDEEERCDLCATPVPSEHRHVLDVERQDVLCACTACSLLFDREGAALGRRRMVPDRRLRLPSDGTVEELNVPVGLAFFVKSSVEDRVVAQYPSPMGATRWDLDVQSWADVERRHPELRDMEPDVEALLVNTARGADERWIVPITDCFRLVAVIRGSWRGLSGGTEVWSEVERFFTELG